MTRRTLKKLSKQAAPFLVKYYGRSEKDVFPAAKGENYHGLIVRCTCRPRRYPLFGCDCRDHPLKGTPMTGEVSGYYEPEWSERTAWDELNDAVYWQGRPEGISDAEWARCQRIARTRPVSDEDLAEMLHDDAEAA